TELLDTLELLRREEERQQARIEGHKAEAEEVLAELELQREELEANLAVVEALKAEADAAYAQADSLLADIDAQIRAAEQHREGLEADAARLEDEIAQLQREAEDEGGAASGGSGALAWPVGGPVVSPFGWRIHPIFGTRKLHTGIDIDAAHGAPIGASGDGTVILATSYGGYGNAVVIDHGGGLSTLYAHQSQIAVSFGQRVSRGELVGYIGCTGHCTGPQLHFEPRVWGSPVDPMQDLGG
ncbi:MAG: M23 family metallopeptidase, partial [Acidimicrobiales bacterium]